ncbi:MAG: amino acid adenylation domain-containing protein, partial [bacterium]|nr:amino acid adenylation domain-containing protein [bacterium]
IENYPLDKEGISKGGNLVVDSYSMVEYTHYDLTVTMKMFDRLEVNYAYDGNGFDKESIERMGEHFTRVLEHFAAHTDSGTIQNIELIAPVEKDRILYEFNDTRAEYPVDKTIHRLLEAQVQKTPDAVAVVFETQHLTYRQLNAAGNRLARLLRIEGVKAGDLVALMPERSLEMLTGLFGILKAGGAYIPIGPEYPHERVKSILEECGAQLALITKGIEVPTNLCRPIPIEPIAGGNEDAGNLTPVTDSSDLAYVIFTSGTTGKPKGVMIENRSVINFIKGITDIIPFTSADRILSLTTLSFDIFVLETILALLKGSRVVIGSREVQSNPQKIAHLMENEQINIFQATPSRLQLLVSEEDAAPKLKQLTYLLVGGEAFPKNLLEKTCEITAGHTGIYNVYGPTETTVWSTLKDVTGERTLNIGKPIANTQIYILGKSGLLQPVGVTGELCIAGEGLSRGYFNNPEQTGKKFVRNPVAPEERLYRTGDNARWLPDGNIEFLGRNDHQVKLRGHRIELEEIKNCLLKKEEINDAVVLARGEDDNKYLCAYIVSDSPLEPMLPVLRDLLVKELPEYMIPSHFITLEQIPLTPNGKIDKNALPEPDTLPGTTYTAPHDRLEKELVKIWAGVLTIDKEQIGIDNNFFQLGGHSLKAATLMTRVHKELDVKISLKEIFKNLTVKQQAQCISNKKKEEYIAIEPAEQKEYYKLSPAQKRLYILQQVDESSTGYNISETLLLEGILNREKLENTFRQLIARHESLRTTFETKDGEPVQKINEKVEFDVQYFNGSAQEATKIIRTFIKPFDFTRTPLLRVGLIQLKNTEHLLIVDMHHIITDGVSQNILMQDFMALYGGEELPGIQYQYKDFSHWQNKLLQSERIRIQENYWLAQFKGEIPVLDLQTDYKRPECKVFEGAFVDFLIDNQVKKKLHSLIKETGTTLYMVLLAVYIILLQKHSGQEDIVVGSPITGRSHPDLQHIIGMFVNMLAMRNLPQKTKPFSRFLEEV